MSLGKLVATAAIREGKFATYFPSYGPEVRGGTAYCFVRVADSPISSPLIDSPDAAILLNQQSIDKFKAMFSKKCFLILNSDLVKDKSQIKTKEVVSLALNKIALESGNIKCANVAALGALLKLKPGILKQSTIVEIIKEIFCNNKELLDQNIKALHKGEKNANC